MMGELHDQAVRQQCKALLMPTIGGQFARLAEPASREGQSHAIDAAELARQVEMATARVIGKTG
jgi:hypothetical protein